MLLNKGGNYYLLIKLNKKGLGKFPFLKRF